MHATAGGHCPCASVTGVCMEARETVKQTRERERERETEKARARETEEGRHVFMQETEEGHDSFLHVT